MSEIASSLYGIGGEFRRLGSERDQIFHISTATKEDRVLRISGRGEALTTLEFQNQALKHIERRDVSLPIPKCLESRNGHFIELVEWNSFRYPVRLMTFVPGVPTLGKSRSKALRRDIGNHLARLDSALNGFGPPPPHETLLWDIRGAEKLHPLIQFIADADGRQLVYQTFNDLASSTLPQLSKFEEQTIHNDFNPKNVLTQPSSPDRVSGIIDFGDMIAGPRIVDVGVAIARHLEPERAVECACDIVAGYLEISRLSEEELYTLFDLICARLAIRSVIWSWRHSLGDVRANLEEVRGALQYLYVFHSLGRKKITSMFLNLTVN